MVKMRFMGGLFSVNRRTCQAEKSLSAAPGNGPGAPGDSPADRRPGQSTRMKSSLPKALHEICGRPMLHYVLEACYGAGCQRVIVVVGHGNLRVDAMGERTRMTTTSLAATAASSSAYGVWVSV